jgi:BirA family biotin operon repressor/biotin-[acetyl-CoA-carboxylase] ligase
MPETFDLRAVEKAVAGTEFARQLHHFASVPSTNDLALAVARAGGREGVWIADQQTAGRGRGSHRWHSAAGDGLYMTALIAPHIPMKSALNLSLTTAIAVQSAIASTFGFRVPSEIDIRWPNDLILNGRKVGGILIDTASNPATPTEPATLRHAIIGIGINVNHLTFPAELDSIATSLRRESVTREARREQYEIPRSVEDSTKCLRREPLAAAILLAPSNELGRLTSNLEPRTSNLSLYSTWITGKRVRVEARDGAPGYTGTTAGLNPGGFLLVAGDDGQVHTVLSGGLREP